jgi:hypothetical protein
MDSRALAVSFFFTFFVLLIVWSVDRIVGRLDSINTKLLDICLKLDELDSAVVKI